LFANGFGPLLIPLDFGGANFFNPPSPPSFFGAAAPGLPVPTPLMDIVSFSPSFNEKSFTGSFLSYISYIPLSYLLYFLKASRAPLKSNESFLSGNYTPIFAFYPVCSFKSNIAKNLELSVHGYTNFS
jgi:hypothetical protein